MVCTCVDGHDHTRLCLRPEDRQLFENVPTQSDHLVRVVEGEVSPRKECPYVCVYVARKAGVRPVVVDQLTEVALDVGR